jgi:predicted  nucleic acid-binding Zn-ribbon protein
MKSEKVFGLKEMALRTILVAVTTAAGIAMTGCSKQFTAIKQNQQAMHKMIQGGNRQMTDSRAAIDKYQKQLQGSIETSTNKLATNMSTVQKKQLQSHNQLTQLLANMTNNIAALQEGQTELGGAIANNTRNLANNMATVERNQLKMHNELGERLANATNSVATMQKNQTKLSGAIANNTRNLANNMATVERNQLKMRNKLSEHLASTTNSVAAMQKIQAKFGAAIANNTRSLADNTKNVAAITLNMQKLQQMAETVQNGTKQTMRRMAVIEQRQDSLKHTLESDIRKLASNVELVVKNLARLEKALADVHSNTEKTASGFALVESNQLNLREQIETNIRQVIESIEALEQQNQTVSPADSDDEAVATEASVAVADDVDAAE